jgi:Domain of unknown function (DUF4431)
MRRRSGILIIFFLASIVVALFTADDSVYDWNLWAKAQKSEERGNTPTRRAEENWVENEPGVVELEGKLTIRTFFGPPNFGENPETDSKEQGWILSLSKPIELTGITSLESGLINHDQNVREVQLVLPGAHKELIGKKVAVKGMLFRAHTGHHHTEIVVDVRSIGLLEDDRRENDAQ